MKNISVLFGVLLLVASCGEMPKAGSLEELKAKQAELKGELSLLNEQISAMDTTKKEVVLLVTSTSALAKPFSHKIELQGSVETDQNVLINSEQPGVIKQIHVKEGQRVSKGQALVTIDSEILQNNIDELETGLEMADYMLNKQLSLNEQGLGTEIELEQAKNQKKSLENKLKTLRTQKGKTVVRAPFSGVVDQIFPNLGEMASPQAPLIRLVNNKDVRVSADVAESHLASIKVGTMVDIIFPNFDNKTISSAVTYLGNFIDPINRTFKVHVDIKNNKLLLPNQLAKIKITDFKLDSALVVNTEAILQDPENNNFVYKMLISKEKKGFYNLEKVYVDIIKSYNGESAIQPLNGKTIADEALLVLSGGKGITESDIVKVQ